MWFTWLRSSWRRARTPVVMRPAEEGLDLREQARKVDRLGVEVVTSGFQREVAVIRLGVGGEGEDGDGGRVGGRLELPGRLPAVDARQAHVHENKVGMRFPGPGHAFLAVDGHDHVVAPPLAATGAHGPVPLV